MTGEHPDQPMDSHDTPSSLTDTLADVRRLMRDLDDVAWPQMDAVFYMHGYDELHLALERLLEAIAREYPDV